MFVLVRPDLEMETLQHDRSVPASLSLLLGPPLLLGGGGAENSGESGEGLMCEEALVSGGGSEEARGVGLEEIGGLQEDQLVSDLLQAHAMAFLPSTLTPQRLPVRRAPQVPA